LRDEFEISSTNAYGVIKISRGCDLFMNSRFCRLWGWNSPKFGIRSAYTTDIEIDSDLNHGRKSGECQEIGAFDGNSLADTNL
jgi:hypothetical protein